MKIESDCPCRHCTSRNETCHAACLDYAEFKAKREIMLDSFAQKNMIMRLASAEETNTECGRRNK